MCAARSRAPLPVLRHGTDPRPDPRPTADPPPDPRSATEPPPDQCAAAIPEDELVRNGWTRRFTAAPPRLDEMIELYRSLGLEVTDQPVPAQELDDDCAGCFATGAQSRVIFTRVPT